MRACISAAAQAATCAGQAPSASEAMHITSCNLSSHCSAQHAHRGVAASSTPALVCATTARTQQPHTQKLLQTLDAEYQNLHTHIRPCAALDLLACDPHPKPARGMCLRSMASAASKPTTQLRHTLCTAQATAEAAMAQLLPLQVNVTQRPAPASP